MRRNVWNPLVKAIFAFILIFCLLGYGTEGVSQQKQAKPLEKVRMAQALEGMDFLSLYVARTNKFFEDEGIALDVIAMSGGGGPNVAAVLAGEAEFTPTSLYVVSGALRQGQDLLIVHNLCNRLIVNLAMRKDVAARLSITENSPLKSKYASLKGLTIGITRPGALTDIAVRTILSFADLNPQRDVQIVGVGTGTAALAALEHKKVDVVAHVSPIPEQVIKNGSGIMFLNVSKGEIPEITEFLGLGLVTTPKFAKSNPETVKKMCRAIRRASVWIHEKSPELTAKILKNYMPDIDLEVLTESVKNMKGAIVVDGKISKNAAVFPQELLVRMGLQKEIIEWTKFVSNDYLPR